MKHLVFKRIIVVVLLSLMMGCSFFGSSVKLSSVTLDVVAQANADSPLAVDFVSVNDDGLLKLLLNLPASEWFKQRDQMLIDYPDVIKVWGLELVPGQHMQTDEVPIYGEKIKGLLVYANYATSGMHRLTLGTRKKVWLRFESKDMRLLDQ